jgi:hypothetical protein
VDFTAELSGILTEAGVSATVKGTAVTGIFDAGYTEEFGMAGTGPVLRIASADVPTVAQGDAVAVGSTNYTVAAVEPDGTGVTLLRLQEA